MELKLTESVLKDIKQYLASTKRAVTTALTAGQQGAALAARLIVELGASYDDAIATIKGQLKEAGLAPNLVNRSRELVPFAVATHGHDERDWPSVEFCRSVLRRNESSVTEAIDEGDWFELVTHARQEAEQELKRAASERGDDGYAPEAEAIDKRVRAARREASEAAPTAEPPRSPKEAIAAVIQLHVASLSDDDKAALRELLA